MTESSLGLTHLTQSIWLIRLNLMTYGVSRLECIFPRHDPKNLLVEWEFLRLQQAFSLAKRNSNSTIEFSWSCLRTSLFSRLLQVTFQLNNQYNRLLQHTAYYPSLQLSCRKQQQHCEIGQEDKALYVYSLMPFNLEVNLFNPDWPYHSTIHSIQQELKV